MKKNQEKIVYTIRKAFLWKFVQWTINNFLFLYYFLLWFFINTHLSSLSNFKRAISIQTEEVFSRATWHNPHPKPEKLKKYSPQKKVLIFQEIELSGSNVKKIRIFSQKKAYISGNGTFWF